MSKTKKKGRLGTRLRGALQEAYGQRGSYRNHLWYVYSPKADQDFVLRSDLEFAHFLLAESDPLVVTINYAPDKRVSASGEGTILDAEAQMTSGCIELREVKYASEIAKGGDSRAQAQIEVQRRIEDELNRSGRKALHRVFTEEEIFTGTEQRLLNWMRVVPWLAQAREWPMSGYVDHVDALIRSQGQAYVEDVLHLRSGSEGALCLAAAFKGLATGRYDSNLDDIDLCPRTLFKAKRKY
jgi:hypothetical protein